MLESPLKLSSLGETGLQLTVLGLGTLTVSPSQNNLPVKQAGNLIAYAVDQGINWLDTADLYNNYDQIKAALNRLANPPHIMSKTYAYTASSARQDFDAARRALDLDHLTAFMLHEQESPLTLAGHQEAFCALLELKEQGKIDAVGISTHAVSVVRSLARAKVGTGSIKADQVPGQRAGRIEVDEQRAKADDKSKAETYVADKHNACNAENYDYSSISKREELQIPACYKEADFVFPLINRTGIGLLDGSWQEMEEASEHAARAGLGVLGMKLFAGGHLLSQRAEAVKTALSLDFVSSWSVGMGTQEEVDVNIDWFSGREPNPALLDITDATPRKLMIESWCDGCGECAKRCKSKALRLADGRMVVDESRCILCSYCAASCPNFAIKIW
ncbi:MAG TPA: 4Fe-4S binding protein [Clostridiaceae bacterium]|nr:4Fe-4S binding protein [Clostridiaceae bacterium]